MQVLRGCNITTPQIPPPEHLTHLMPLQNPRNSPLEDFYLLSTPTGVQGLAFQGRNITNYLFPYLIAESEINTMLC